MREMIWMGGSVGEGLRSTTTCIGASGQCSRHEGQGGSAGTYWGADEDAVEGAVRLSEALDLEGRLERLDLRTEAVARHGDGDAAEQLLPALFRVFDPAREEDRARAGAPDGLRLEELTHGFQQPREARE